MQTGNLILPQHLRSQVPHQALFPALRPRRAMMVRAVLIRLAWKSADSTRLRLGDVARGVLIG